MNYLELFVGEGAQGVTENLPVLAQEYIDGHAVIAFPPPYTGQLQKLQFLPMIMHSSIIVECGDGIVAILYHTHILVCA